MSPESIIKNLGTLVALHKNMNQIAKRKTGIIVKGDTTSLQMIVKDEKKHIQAIQQVNNELMQEGSQLLLHSKISESPTLSMIMDCVEEEARDKLQKLKGELEEQVAQLNQQNKTNQELLKQSMQFVQLSLDLLSPDIDSFNYSRTEQDSEKQSRSIFDSKA